ncbi:unnamed protein product, partial [Prorocentrum cordatum]
NATSIEAAMSFLTTPSWGLKRRGDASAVTDAPPNKKHISELLAAGEDVSTVGKLFVVLTKLSLMSAAGIREIIGMLWNTVLVDVKGSVAKHMLEQGRVHHDATQTAKNDTAALDALGPPYAHVFAGLMQGVAEYNLEDSMKVLLASFWEKQAVKEGLVKVTIATSAVSFTLHSYLVKALASNGGVLKHGPAPRGPLERAAQEPLEELEGGKSNKDKGKGKV